MSLFVRRYMYSSILNYYLDFEPSSLPSQVCDNIDGIKIKCLSIEDFLNNRPIFIIFIENLVRNKLPRIGKALVCDIYSINQILKDLVVIIILREAKRLWSVHTLVC